MKMVTLRKLLFLFALTSICSVLGAQTFLIPVTNRKDIVFDKTRNLVYITAGNTLYRFDISTKQLLTPFTVQTTLHGADITPDGQYLYAATMYNSIVRIDLSQGISYIMPFTPYSGAESGTWDVKIMANNKAFFSTQYAGSGWLPLGIIDITTNEIYRGNTLYTEPIRFSRSTNRNVLFIPNPNNSSGPIYLYDAQKDAISCINRLNVYLSNSQSCVNFNGSITAMEFGSRIDFFGATLNKFKSMNCSVGGIEFHPVKNILYYSDIANDDLVAVETSSFTELFRIGIDEDLLNSDRCGFGHGEMLIEPASSLLFLSTSMGVRVIEIPVPDNAKPIANAGENQTIIAFDNEIAEVKFDAAGSYDPDGDALEYFWYNDANELIATGVAATVVLPVGVHGITLIVNDGIVNSEPDEVVITVSPENNDPIADAGDDQLLYAWIDALAEVTLNGIGSTDADEDALNYFWYNDANELIATGAEPNVLLPVGDHIITLIVNDGVADSEPDSCTITVLPATETQINVRPGIVALQKLPVEMLVKMDLPAGTDAFNFETPMMLEPFRIAAYK